jgi:hypothetical protein
MDIYTAQYKYAGSDRIDITIKGNVPPGNILAPTWEMVRALQDGKITQWDYAIKYFALLMDRMHRWSDTFRIALDEIVQDRPEITLTCFCPANEFCHRVLAARMLEEMRFGVYKGERVF